ncbi:MAG: hypothetical protein QF701_09815 [Nitrospinota bacterium]|nr:hypothetical protein [Nitrospinota bacterium]MDP7168030.1 hypothetical protein [Nitrospinota bacterium]MDP7369340.1 hypothetical protein [Nitrospinota bacterium]
MNEMDLVRSAIPSGTPPRSKFIESAVRDLIAKCRKDSDVVKKIDEIRATERAFNMGATELEPNEKESEIL